jgi:hypothetical protein
MNNIYEIFHLPPSCLKVKRKILLSLAIYKNRLNHWSPVIEPPSSKGSMTVRSSSSLSTEDGDRQRPKYDYSLIKYPVVKVLKDKILGFHECN